MAQRPFPSFLIFADDKGHWRWNFADKSGKVIASASQAYARPAGCARVIQEMQKAGEVPVLVRDAVLRPMRPQPARPAEELAAEAAMVEIPPTDA
ncbi:MAG: YegP family protein [Sphingomonadales bacterium]